VLDDAASVAGVGKAHVQHIGVAHSLLQAGGGMFVLRLCLQDSDRDVAPDEEDVIGTQAGVTPVASLPHGDDAARGQDQLLGDVIVFPPGGVQFGQDMSAAGIGFVHRSPPEPFRDLTGLKLYNSIPYNGEISSGASSGDYPHLTAKPAKSAKRIKRRVSLRPLRSLRFKKTPSLPCILTCG